MSEVTSITSAVNGERDPVTGRVLPGNRLAKGNPQNKRMQQLRGVLQDCLTDDEMRRVGKKLIEQAAEGDTAAAKILLDHAMGRPPQAIALTDADGQSIALSLTALRSIVLEVAGNDPDARAMAAERLHAALSTIRKSLGDDDI